MDSCSCTTQAKRRRSLPQHTKQIEQGPVAPTPTLRGFFALPPSSPSASSSLGRLWGSITMAGLSAFAPRLRPAPVPAAALPPLAAAGEGTAPLVRCFLAALGGGSSDSSESTRSSTSSSEDSPSLDTTS